MTHCTHALKGQPFQAEEACHPRGKKTLGGAFIDVVGRSSVAAQRKREEVLEECRQRDVCPGREMLLEVYKVPNGLGLGSCMSRFVQALTILQNCSVENAIAHEKAGYDRHSFRGVLSILLSHWQRQEKPSTIVSVAGLPTPLTGSGVEARPP
jgi:hypothetical protein